MTNHERQEKRIRALYKKWAPLLGMGEWDVTMRFHDGQYVQPDGVASGSAIGTSSTDWEYRRSTIDWNTSLCALETDDRMEGHVIHECMHVLLGEMDEDGVKHEERVVTSLMWAFLRVARSAK